MDFWDNFCLWCLSNDDVDLAIRMGMGASPAGEWRAHNTETAGVTRR